MEEEDEEGRNEFFVDAGFIIASALIVAINSNNIR